jgi:methionyl-tRNA synthetase
MVFKYRDGAVPGQPASPLDDDRVNAVKSYREKMDGYLLHEGLEVTGELVRAANAYVDQTQPWQLAREERDAGAPGDALDAALGSLVRTLGTSAALLAPFIPRKAAEIWKAVGGGDGMALLDDLEDTLLGLARVQPGPVLFPRPE